MKAKLPALTKNKLEPHQVRGDLDEQQPGGGHHRQDSQSPMYGFHETGISVFCLLLIKCRNSQSATVSWSVQRKSTMDLLTVRQNKNTNTNTDTNTNTNILFLPGGEHNLHWRPESERAGGQPKNQLGTQSNPTQPNQLGTSHRKGFFLNIFEFCVLPPFFYLYHVHTFLKFLFHLQPTNK